MAGEDSETQEALERSLRVSGRNGESPRGIKEGSDIVRVGLRKVR